MPGGNRTGPEGFGPMTGRGRGLCSGYTSPGYMDGVPAFRGHRNMYFATGRTRWQRSMSSPEFTKDQEIDALSVHIESMQRELDANKKRLEELNRETED